MPPDAPLTGETRDARRGTSYLIVSRVSRLSSLVSLFAIALLGPATAQSVSLRYHPGPGVLVTTVSDTRTSAVLFGLPSLPDSSVVENDWRRVQTTRVLEVTGERNRVRLALDSSRARVRSGTRRVDVPLPGAQGLALEAQIGPRGNIATATSATRNADSAYVAVLRARLGGLEFLLPEGPMDVGGSWTSPVQFPFGAHLTAGSKLSAVSAARGSATLSIDSVRARGADTLAFLSLAATFDPMTVAVAGEGGVGTGTVNGRIAAALVWSTGWNAVVSAATNARIEMRIQLSRSEGPPVEGSVSLSIAERHQVRL
jgi:hypothetical protein